MTETTYCLPAPVRLSIALLADLHNRPFEAIIPSLRSHQPDIICIAGDVVYGSEPLDETPVIQTNENVLPFFRACSAIAPTFFSLGNHEWMLSPADFTLIQETGVTLLDNAFTPFGDVLIGGLTSALATSYQAFRADKPGRYPLRDGDFQEMPGPDTRWLDAFEKMDGYKILLSHQPEYWSRYLKPRPISLTLSGHAHGGQIRLFDHGLFAPGQGILPRYTSGVHEGRLVISRGLSNTAFPVPRLFNPPETVYIQLS